MKPSLYFLPPVQLWRGVRDRLWNPARVNPVQLSWSSYRELSVYLLLVCLLVLSENSLEGWVKRTSVRPCIPTSPIACWSGSCQRALITFQQNDGEPEAWKCKDYWPANFSAPSSSAIQTLMGIWKTTNELGEARATGSSVKGQRVTWTAPEPWFLAFPFPKGLHLSGLWLHTLKVNVLQILWKKTCLHWSWLSATGRGSLGDWRWLNL